MRRVKKRGNRWFVRYYDEDKYKELTGFKTEHDAMVACASKMAPKIAMKIQELTEEYNFMVKLLTGEKHHEKR